MLLDTTLAPDRITNGSGEASQHAEGRSLVFMDESWSQCPANLWVPAMLQGVWRRALRHVDE